MDHSIRRSIGPSETAEREHFAAWGAEHDDGSVGASIERTRGGEDGELIGALSVKVTDRRARGGELGIVLGPDFLGRGYGSSAIRSAVRLAFDEMGLHRLQLRTLASNSRAVAAYESAGFAREGTLRDAVFVAGRWEDLVLLSVLEHERRP